MHFKKCVSNRVWKIVKCTLKMHLKLIVWGTFTMFLSKYFFRGTLKSSVDYNWRHYWAMPANIFFRHLCKLPQKIFVGTLPQFLTLFTIALQLYSQHHYSSSNEHTWYTEFITYTPLPTVQSIIDRKSVV